jgi:hypothetical protein
MRGGVKDPILGILTATHPFASLRMGWTQPVGQAGHAEPGRAPQDDRATSRLGRRGRPGGRGGGRARALSARGHGLSQWQPQRGRRPAARHAAVRARGEGMPYVRSPACRTYVVHGQSVILFAESPVIGFIQWFCCSVYEYPGTRTTVQTSRHSYMAGCPCMHGPCVVLRRIGHWIYRVTIASNTHACSSSVLI